MDWCGLIIGLVWFGLGGIRWEGEEKGGWLRAGVCGIKEEEGKIRRKSTTWLSKLEYKVLLNNLLRLIADG